MVLLLLVLVLLLLILLLLLVLLLLVLILLLLVLLLLLILSLLRILLRFLLLFFQFFNFLLQFFRFFAVNQKKLLVSGDGRNFHTFTQSFFINILSHGNLFQSLIHLFKSSIQLLSGKSLLRLVENRTCLLMIDHAEILVGSGADFLIFRRSPDCLFIELQCFLRILFFFLRFQTVIVKINGSRIPVHSFFLRHGSLLLWRFLTVRELGILRGKGGGSGKEQSEKKHGLRRGSVHSLFRKTEPDAKQEKRSGKRINRTLNRTGLFPAVDFLFRKFLNACFQLFQPRIGRRGTHINTAGFLSKGAETALIQRAFHDIALRVLECTKPALFVGNLNQGRLCGIADTGNEQRNFEFDNLTDRFAGIPVKFIAVRNQENGAVGSFRGTEAVNRRGKSLFDIGAAYGNRICAEIVKRSQKTGLVNGQRTFKKSLSGKSDEPETVAGVHLYKFTDKPFRMFQARRAHILRKHAPRGIEYHHDVASLPGVRLNAHSPGRARRRDKKKNQGTCKQNRSPETAYFRCGGIRRIFRTFSKKTLQ